MTSRTPIVRQIAWLSVVPQLAIMWLFMWFFSLADVQQAVLLGVLAYLALSMSLRFGIAKAHRRGISLFKRKQYAEAVPEFERSYDFFRRNKWMDDWRFLMLLSSSRISYREMALLNLAFCHSQAGNGLKAKECYQRALAEFPYSEMAKVSLKMIESVEKTAEPSSVGNVATRAAVCLQCIALSSSQNKEHLNEKSI